MRIGTLVRINGSSPLGLIISTLGGSGYFDVKCFDGIIRFAHQNELEIISEARRPCKVLSPCVTKV